MKKILLLLVALLATTTVWAEDFITDVMVIGGTQSEVNNLKASYEAQGWIFIDQDLNAGAGGDCIYLLYKNASDTVPDATFITNFAYNNAPYPEILNTDGRVYTLVPCAGGSDFTEGQGNLNSGTNGIPVYLYYTKTYTDDELHTVRSITFNDTPEGAIPELDLNFGCTGADEIYMHTDISKGWTFWQGNDTECIITGFDGPKARITSYTVPTYHDGLKVVSVSSFEGFINLETLYFYNDSYIDQMPSMEGCTKFKHVNIISFVDDAVISTDQTPNRMTTIPDNAFIGTAIEKIKLTSVTSVGDYAFEGCNLSEVHFMKSDFQIGYRAFANISSNCLINQPSGSIDNWDPSMYMFSPNLVINKPTYWYCGWCGGSDYNSYNYLYWTHDNVADHLKISTYGYFWESYPDEQVITTHTWDGLDISVDTLTLNNVYAIGEREFEHLGVGRSVKDVYVDAALHSIGKEAFYDCAYLRNFWFDGNDEQWNAVTKDSQWKNGTSNLVEHWHCTVTFDANGHGTAPAAQNIEWSNKDKATEPTAPTAEGFVFTGWYTDAACSILWNFNNKVPGDMTLYAGWRLVAVDSEIVEVTAAGITFNMIKVDGNDDISAFYIGECEVTEALWQAVMGDNPSSFQGNLEDNLPVENISWNDCQAFLAKLKLMTKLDFRLPTSAEWLFAASGGNYNYGLTYSGSNAIDDVAWYNGNCSQKMTIGTKSPNVLGIHDMSGNVYEIIQEATEVYGGGWHSSAQNCVIGYYWPADEDFTDNDTGFRLALTNFDEIQTVIGDVDGDGYVTTVDITCIYNYLLNGDETYLSTSDVDGDGFITTTDITVIYNILLGSK